MLIPNVRHRKAYGAESFQVGVECFRNENVLKGLSLTADLQ